VSDLLTEQQQQQQLETISIYRVILCCYWLKVG